VVLSDERYPRLVESVTASHTIAATIAAGREAAVERTAAAAG
jgi:hypothetical protein